MRQLLKHIFTLEPPLGETWVVITVTTILAILGLVEFSESLAWIASGLAFIALLLTVYLVQKTIAWLWGVAQKKGSRKDGV